MSDSIFTHDVFLSHSAKDAAVVRPLAERLLSDGVRVWFDEWEVVDGDDVAAKVEDGLERSRVLVLCMSEHAFGEDWTHLEASTLRFRDPLNTDRRFIPLRLDETPIKDSLRHVQYINWLPGDHERGYVRLLDACRHPVHEPDDGVEVRTGEVILLKAGKTRSVAFAPSGEHVLASHDDHSVRLWHVGTRRCIHVLEGHSLAVHQVVWSTDQRRAISCSDDRTLRLWDLDTGKCLRVFEGHTQGIWSVAWNSDQLVALSGQNIEEIRLWDVENGECLRTLQGHTDVVLTLDWSPDQRHAVSGGGEGTLRIWDVETGYCLRVLEAPDMSRKWVLSVAWSPDQRLIASSSQDAVVRVWDVETGRCLRILEGHEDWVGEVAWARDGRHLLSGSDDGTIRLWNVETGNCVCLLEGLGAIEGLSWSTDQRRVFAGDFTGAIGVWDVSDLLTGSHGSGTRRGTPVPPPGQVQYTNAKVLLVGESGAGKTGLSKVLAGERWEPSDSTVGAWSTQWKLPVSTSDGVEREVWLWDFGGQADQRLIHQLYMEATALAVLVFDGQKEDLFETVGQWDRDLSRASSKSFSKLLVAGRIDAGGLRVSRSQVEALAKERGFSGYFETSAKTGSGCKELREAIIGGIPWEEIPWRSSPVLFKHLKDEIIRLKDDGRVLLRFNELRETLRLRLPDPEVRFSDEELKAVIGLLAGPGVLWELKFGNWVLLQPERVNAYAQAVIQTLRADEHERGCLAEERVLNGDLVYHSSLERLPGEDERFVLLAMHQTLVERGLCLREHTGEGPLLIFPSYYRRERPELVGHPAVLVSYRFTGFLDDIYATLVVRLHHTAPFHQDELWRYAADFKTLTGKQLGVKLTRRAEGAGELEVYFDPAIESGEKIIFSRYVHEHLLRAATDVVRLRHYVCPHCGTPVGNREVAMRRLDEWLDSRGGAPAASRFESWRGKSKHPTILCVNCEKRVPLWDEIEQHFASAETRQRVRELEEQSNLVLDNESKERALVGEVISTIALAGQISREKSVSDHGIDMEVEFKDDHREATGKMVLLQLKSGNSYLRRRKSDGAEIFRIPDERHARYWMEQPFPVLLVIRNSEGEIRWMEVRDYLRRASGNGENPVKQIVFEGQRFDVMSVRRWRDSVLTADGSWREGSQALFTST